MAIITISRGTMSGGKKLAEMLAKCLGGYRCVSREIIIKAADDYGVPESKLFDAIQKGPSIFQKLTFERERYLAYIQASLCEFANEDNLVYHGHAGHLLLEGVAHVLKIRILASPEFRIKAAVEQFHFDESEAAKYIERVDKERDKWTKFLYGKDWRSPELYDIVFNLENADLKFVCEMVCHAAKQPQFQATEESKKAVYDLLIASRVRAALAGNRDVRLEYLDIKANDGKVIIKGRVKSQVLTREVLETAGKVAGVKEVRDEIDIDYRGYPVD
jgi:cytidylate kinase